MKNRMDAAMKFGGEELAAVIVNKETTNAKTV